MTLFAFAGKCGLGTAALRCRPKKPSPSRSAVSASPAKPPPICQIASRRVSPHGYMSASVDVEEFVGVEQHVTQRGQGERPLAEVAFLGVEVGQRRPSLILERGPAK